MNRTTAAAAMVAALIAGVTPLTLLSIHEQNQKKEEQAYVQQLERENSYLECLDDSVRITLNWVQTADGVRTYYTPEGKEFKDKKIIEAYERATKRCEDLKKEK
jgi:hypothetical protein